MLLALVTSLALAAMPQGGDETAPEGLTIVVVNVGQGHGLVLKTADGKVHVFDGGPNGQGTASLIPVIHSLAPSSYGATFMTHWHSDHQGGLDEVLGAFAFTDAYDRGDVNRINGTDTNNYLAAAGTRRRAVTSGMVIALGGGAQATVIAQNGQIKGGANVPVTGLPGEENARSLATRIDYGSFSMWIGGDLTGGNGTPDCETPASVACGNVDACLLNHHGLADSTNAAFMGNLTPELALLSCGSPNTLGSPSATVVSRITQAAAARVLWSTTAGTGAVGFGSAGNITITTDGKRYRARAASGKFLDFLCDELQAQIPTASGLEISEIQRHSGLAQESLGEYIEITNVGQAPVGLKGVEVSGSGGAFTIQTNLVAYPGRPLIVHAHGDTTQNGGLPLGFVWPAAALSLGNTSDTLLLKLGTTTLDQVAYASGFPGGAGVAAERTDLYAPASNATFRAALLSYGSGGRGSPGARNGGDVTPYVAGMHVSASTSEIVFRASDLANGAKISVVGVAFGSTPGFPFLNAQIPLNPDALFTAVLGLPGYVTTLPAEGYRSLTLPLPLPNPIAGYRGYAAHVVLDLSMPAVAGLSTATAFVFP